MCWKAANSIVKTNCTYGSADYYTWYAQPNVAHYAGLSNDATQ